METLPGMAYQEKGFTLEERSDLVSGSGAGKSSAPSRSA